MKFSSQFRFFPLTMLVFLATHQAWCAAPPNKVTGIYSNLHYVPEAGDVLGTEVIIVYAADQGYFAVIQCSEGAPSKPVIVKAVIHGNNVELSPHGDESSSCPSSKFVGKFTKTGLQGSFEGTSYPGILKRKNSYWQ